MRPGMSCEEFHLTDERLHADSANDDSVDPWSAHDLMGDTLWLDYVERWNPLRWVPRRTGRRRRSA